MTNKFDPMTGEPIPQMQDEQQPQQAPVQFDPVTGQPIPQTYVLNELPEAPKKFPILPVIGGVCGVALVVGGIILGINLLTPKSNSKKMVSTVQDTLEDMADKIELANVTKENMDSISLGVNDEYTMVADFKNENANLGVTYVNSKNKKQLLADISASGVSTNAAIELEDKKIKLSIPVMFNDQLLVYDYGNISDGFLTQNVGEENLQIVNQMLDYMLNSDASMNCVEDFTEVITDNYNSWEFNDSDPKNFEIDGKSVECEGTTAVIKKEDAEKLVKDTITAIKDSEYMKKLTELMVMTGGDSNTWDEAIAALDFSDFKDLSLSLYYYDDMYAAIELMDESEQGISIRFKGGDYRMQNVEVLMNDEVLFGISGNISGDVANTVFSVNNGGEVMEIASISVNSGNGDVVFSIGNKDQDAFEVTYNIESNKDSLVIRLDDISQYSYGSQYSLGITGSMTFTSGADFEEIKGEEKVINEMSQEEFTELFSILGNFEGMI